jgi:hypothetical protein
MTRAANAGLDQALIALKIFTRRIFPPFPAQTLSKRRFQLEAFKSFNPD